MVCFIFNLFIVSISAVMDHMCYDVMSWEGFCLLKVAWKQMPLQLHKTWLKDILAPLKC